MRNNNNKGTGIALLVICTWLAGFLFLMQYTIQWSNPVWVIGILWQMHLYTGLFITAHDAMHGTVSNTTKTNNFIGSICLALYAAFSFKQLVHEHHRHHREVATENDPDYHHGTFFRWYLNFVFHYLRWWQFVILGALFNVLHYLLHIPQANLLLFWVLPPILSTFQLFYFGTYLPHRKPHELNNPHKSRTQNKNHILAFITCYFFGYHFEHHDKPYLPWWQLWKTK